MIIEDVLIELRKLKGTLVVVLCLVAPTLAATLMTLMSIRMHRHPWQEGIGETTGLWAFFVLPMTVTALSALMAHLEHGPRLWDHLLALPIRRWRIYTAKGLVIMILVALMSLLLALEIRAGGLLLHYVFPAKEPTGAFDWGECAKLLGSMWAASLFMVMIQLWVALHFRSFVAPLTVGLAGTFVAVAAMSAKEAIYVPWVMPVSILVGHGARAEQALQLGLIGGLITFALMILHLSRKEA